MKVLESQSAVLTNYEVLAHLSSTAAKPRTTPQTHQNVSTIFKELTDYLSPPPDSRSPLPPYSHSSSYSDTKIRALITGLKPYNLTKAETLMILNLRPGDLGLLDCVVEECDERFTADQQEGILSVVGDVLGRVEEGDEGEGEANGVDGMDGVEGVNGTDAVGGAQEVVNGDK